MKSGTSWKALGALVLAAALAVTSTACRPDDEKTGSVNVQAGQQARSELPPAVVAHLDSGSVAFRANDYEAARRHYREAARLAPKQASTWFGVYMAEKALGNAAAADSALARVRELAPGATLLHTSDHDTAGS